MDPFKCRLWDLHARLSSEIDSQTCEKEIASLSQHGQLLPVLGRPLTGDSDHEVELIYGARRLFSARHLNIPLLVEMRDVSDRDGLIAMDIENRQRKDISPYERGLMYRNWLVGGHFESQEDLARTLEVSASQVSRLLQLTRLPAVVVDAFRSPAEIQEGWGLQLLEALEDPQRRATTIRVARSLSSDSPRRRSRDVMRKLLSFSPRGRKPKPEAHDRIVRRSDGSPLFRVRYLANSISLVFAADKAPKPAINHIERTLIAVLQHRGVTAISERTRSGNSGKIAAAGQDWGTK